MLCNSAIITYVKSNESLERAGLNQEALVIDRLHDTVEYLTLDGSEYECLELDLVDNFTSRVLDATIRCVLWLHTTNIE